MARKRTAQEIDAEIARLQAERGEVWEAERAEVIARIKPAVAHYSITAADLGLGRASAKRKDKAMGKPGDPPKKAKKAPAPVKWKDDAGHTWSGRGPKPRWFTEALASGKTEEDLRA